MYTGFIQGNHCKFSFIKLNICTWTLSFSKIPIQKALYVVYGMVKNSTKKYFLRYSQEGNKTHIYSTYDIYLVVLWFAFLSILRQSYPDSTK